MVWFTKREGLEQGRSERISKCPSDAQIEVHFG